MDEYRKAQEKNKALSRSKVNMHDRPNTHKNDNTKTPICTEAQTVLLCLDYLRALRRNHHGTNELEENEGIKQDYVTLAIWALTRCFAQPDELVLKSHPELYNTGQGGESDPVDMKSSSYLLNNGNDPYFQHELAESNFKIKHSQIITKLTEDITIPTMNQMNEEVIYLTDPRKITGEGRDEGSQPDTSSWYKYNDMHYSNKHRIYKYDGLGSTPLDLQQLIAQGLQQTKGMSRQQGEDIMMKDRMFTDFMDAVKAKGFFEISEKDVMNNGGARISALSSKQKKDAAREEIYQERYRKVVSKFRQKLVDNGLEEEFERKLLLREKEADTNGVDIGGSGVERFDDEATVTGSVVGAMETDKENGTLHFDDNESISRKLKSSSSGISRRRLSMAAKASRKDIEEAEKSKLAGNALMQKKKYKEAKDCYTKALGIAPSGPTSHVYYSNRAAALLSMRNFTEAVWDAERSVALKPDYPKAYARLGLAHFLLGQYKEAVEAYTMAVKFEPNNETSVSYLDRSKKKLSMLNRGNGADDDDGSVNSRRSSRSERRMSRSRNGSRRSSVAVSKSAVQHPQYAPLDSDDEKKTLNVKVDRSQKGRIDREGRGEEEQDGDNHETSSSVDKISDDKLDEANRLKVEGNKSMARKEYAEAIKLYSMALRLAPAGPQSHVYFSNRAAALCYLERYEEAELDAERALALDPEFGKAHARLGLARYFLRDYDGAVEAYESAADHDPHNESNRIYLAKAKLKLGRHQSLASKSRE
jgi:tetratricopeptide (TPR) repeat protein